MGRHKKYDVVKSIRIGLSQLEKNWLESHSSQSELINSLIRKEMTEIKTLNPKIEEIVARAIARLSVEGVVLNCHRIFIDAPELEVVQISEHKSKIIPSCKNYKIIFLATVNDIDGRSESHWHLVDCPNPFALVIDKSCLDEDDCFRLKDAKNIPEWMLAKLAVKDVE